MKTLFLVRHAKSSWEDSGLSDRDRPLAQRGERDAPKMAKHLAKQDVDLDLILSSPATRALATAKIFAEKLQYKKKNIVVDERLYPGHVHQLFELVRGLDDKLRRVMLFGHNPAFLEFAHRLSKTIKRMPTSAVAAFVFDAKSWSELGEAELRSVLLDYPKKSQPNR